MKTIPQNVFCDHEKLIKYLASTVIMVSSNRCDGSSQRTNISFFLPSICADKI